MDTFRQIAHLLTQADRKATGKRGHNPYALAIELGALHDMEDIVNHGGNIAVEFTLSFNPTAKNHRIASADGLALDVQRGQCIHSTTAEA